MSKQKLSVFLGLRERLEKTFQNALEDMFNKYKSKQGLFKGQRNTYIALDGYADEPNKRAFVNVSSTVSEQFDWFADHNKDFMNVVFSIERTNSKGEAKAELVVDGQSWGIYSSLELLRLKSILDGKLKAVISEIPVRSESSIWTKSVDEAFSDRNIYETKLELGYAKTTLKESYILPDPHADKGNRQPMIAEKSTQVNIGEYTSQSFSGEFSMKERATLIAKLNILYKSVISALETANNVEVESSDLGEKVMDYMFK
jgi:hypothetical protein